jgi:hypothetical protein
MEINEIDFSNLSLEEKQFIKFIIENPEPVFKISLLVFYSSLFKNFEKELKKHLEDLEIIFRNKK